MFLPSMPKGDIVGQFTLSNYVIWYVGIDVNWNNIEVEIYAVIFQVTYGLKSYIGPTPLESALKEIFNGM